MAEGEAAAAVGARLRSLRRLAGLSQEELAAGRFSKEYVSQIERGKTRPTRETLRFFAERLEVDPDLLEYGVSQADAVRFDAALLEAEKLVESHRYDDALLAYRAAREIVGNDCPAAFSLRLLKGEAWARIRTGELDAAMQLLDAAASLAVGPGFGAVDRAEIVFEVGVVRYQQSSIDDAIVLLGEALQLAEVSESRSDRLRSDIFHWRSRCHRRNRDWVAAEEDIEHALAFAESYGDPRRVADALFQASLVTQRQGRWVLARTYAERSRALFEELGDAGTVARLLNNLAGLNHLLGDTSTAVAQLQEAFAMFVDLDLAVDAGYVCSSLASILLDGGEPVLAEEQAEKALRLLDGRADHVQEIGMAQVALGRALAAQGRLDEAESWIHAADDTFDRARSVGHRSHAWIAEGDVQRSRGDEATAAQLYRRAAVSLLDSDVIGE